MTLPTGVMSFWGSYGSTQALDQAGLAVGQSVLHRPPLLPGSCSILCTPLPLGVSKAQMEVKNRLSSFVVQLLSHVQHQAQMEVKNRLSSFVVSLLSHVQLFATPWTVALQAPPSMKFSRQNTGVGSHSLLWGNLPDPGIEPRSPSLWADSLPSEPLGKPLVEVSSSQLLPLSLLHQHSKQIHSHLSMKAIFLSRVSKLNHLEIRNFLMSETS